jgi:hypothetical protein
MRKNLEENCEEFMRNSPMGGKNPRKVLGRVNVRNFP